MNKKDLKPLISLLEDNDLRPQIEKEILVLGSSIIPFLEKESTSFLSTPAQESIALLIHKLQLDLLKERIVAWGKGESDDLLKGMWLIATYQYPNLDLEELKKGFNILFKEVALSFKTESSPYNQVKLLTNIFFHQHKFKGNSPSLNSPANSMLNDVIALKKGNTITLSVLYMVIAQKLGLPIYGVKFPHFFILTYYDKAKDFRFYINTSTRGLIFTKQDIEHYLSQIDISLHPKFDAACSHISIVIAVLEVLVITFENLNQHQKSEELKQLISSLQF